jgi:ribosomal protein S18 acetylase RimI-like enzyme
MAAIQEGLRLHLGGDRPGARTLFAGLWTEIGEDGDPLHRCALAHYMADVQDDVADELAWDLRALHAADSLTDERAREHHSSLAVKGFYPSLHLNLGEDYRKLGDLANALEQLALARATLDALGSDDYAAGIRAGLDGLAERLGEPVIRVADPAEFAALREVELDSDKMFPELEFPPGGILDEIDASHTVLAAGNPPIGFIVTGPVGDHLHVHQLSVRRDHGRRGVGSALLAAAVDGAGVPVTLTTFTHVPWNAPWYLARGFEVFDAAGWGPELRELVAAEKAAGLEELGPRVVLRRFPKIS